MYNVCIVCIGIYSELNELYNELEQINLQVKYSSDMFYNTSDDENLVNYTNAISIFQHLKNSKITGIILNNLGNTHQRYNNRFVLIWKYQLMQLFCMLRKHPCSESKVQRSNYMLPQSLETCREGIKKINSFWLSLSVLLSQTNLRLEELQGLNATSFSDRLAGSRG